MFVRVAPRFREVVSVQTPDPSAVGASKTESFEIIFEAASKEVSQAADVALKAADGAVEAIAIQDAFIVGRAVDWADVVDHHGDVASPVPFDREALAALLHHPGVRQAVWDAYWTGLTRARGGNSPASAAPSPSS